MILSNGSVFIDGGFKKLNVRVNNGYFTEFSNDIVPLPGERIIDCTDRRVLPGLVEIHSHGCLGFDFSKSSADEDEKMCEFYADHGVTSILATTMTNELGQYKRALSSIRELMERQAREAQDIESYTADGRKGARIRGVNMEGPFLSEKKRGAHDPQYLYPIDEELFTELDGLCNNAIKLISFAPELEGSKEFIEKHKADKVLSIAHSACDYKAACEAIDAGATHVTHLFNAMNGLQSREPGIIGAAADRDIYSEIICDGHHIHPSVIRLMFKAIPEKLVLISDSVNPTGMPEGKYTAGGLDVIMKDGIIRMLDGTIAGSTITMSDALKRAISFGVKEEAAVLSATYLPAKSVNMEKELGVIAQGRQADFIIVDNDYELKEVYIAGGLVRNR